MRVLRLNMKGADVKRWQIFLIGQKLDVGLTDGDFGKRTRDATIQFQQKNGLDPDGAVGNQTLGKAMILGFEIATDPTDASTTGENFPPPPNFSVISSAERERLFGKFAFKIADSSGNITITDGWESRNIIKVPIPQLIGVKGAPASGNIRFHKLAAPQLVALWQAWEAAGLLDRVLTWDGSFVARLQRGSKTKLSNHAFGTTFDINAAFNPLNVQPKLVGQKGSLRELVSIANDHGFFWGGHFKSRKDGMHFETAFIK